MKPTLLSLGIAAALMVTGLSVQGTAHARDGADDVTESAYDDYQDNRHDDDGRDDDGRGRAGLPVKVSIKSPERNDQVGIEGRGWVVDLELEYQVPLARSGFTVRQVVDGVTPGFQLTGPAGHNNVLPFPGTFSPGVDDRLPGLIVLLTTTNAANGGPCQNLANLFNLTGITDLKRDEVTIRDTWLIGAANFGTAVNSTLFVAVAKDLNGDGIYNDAPDKVTDSDGDGLCTHQDLMDHGVISNIDQVHFHINGIVDLTGVPVVPPVAP